MQDTKISEKTLELNLSEELMTIVRAQHPNAFWYGPTLQDEKDLGYDTSLENAAGIALFFQFKRPLKFAGAEPKEFPYRFKIQKEQNNALVKLGKKFPKNVHYVFPLIGNDKELASAIPNIRKETNFTPIEIVGELSGTNEHRVDVWRDRVKVYSPIEGPSIKPAELINFSQATTRTTFGEFKRVYNQIIIAEYAMPVSSQFGDEGYLMDSSPLHAMFIPT